MKVSQEVKKTAITSLVTVLGQGDLFSRVKSEIERVNKKMPSATGSDKRKQVLADLRIIFDDVVLPVGEAVLNLLIELGVAYLTVQYPVAGAVAGAVVPGVEAAAKQKIDEQVASNKE